MKGLLHIQTVHVPLACALEAHSHFQRVGMQGLEGFALWAGEAIEDQFYVRHTIIPAQKAYRSPNGLCVVVEAPELHRINVWLYQNKLTLVAQLHSHPTDAFHSPTDDNFPISTTVGSYSVVVPDFARAPFALVRCAVFRLSVSGEWDEVPWDEVSRTISITE